MKIQLVQAPSNYSGTTSSGCYPPLSLLSIATYIFRQQGIRAEIIDGEIMSLKKATAQLDADIVGFTVNSLNAQNSVYLSMVAKEKGAIVVWGGSHPTVRYKQIIANQDSVDYVVRGDGEQAFLNIVTGDIQNSPNIAFKDKKNISSLELSLNTYPFPDYSLLFETRKYISNFQKRKPGIRVLGVYSHRGCAFRQQNGPCIFCTISDKKVRFRDPDQFVGDVLGLQQEYGITHLRDYGDSITGSRVWLKDVADRLKDKGGPEFFIYARADEISDEVAELMKEMGVSLVYLGGESGDDHILKTAKKKETRAQILRAAELLNHRNIDIRPSFIAGLPGESRESIDNTRELIESLLGLSNIVYIPYSIIMPIPGSEIFRIMERKFPYLKEGDIFDLHELQKLWVNNFCDISFDELDQEYRRIKTLNSSKFDKGMGDRVKK